MALDPDIASILGSSAEPSFEGEPETPDTGFDSGKPKLDPDIEAMLSGGAPPSVNAPAKAPEAPKTPSLYDQYIQPAIHGLAEVGNLPFKIIGAGAQKGLEAASALAGQPQKKSLVHFDSSKMLDPTAGFGLTAPSIGEIATRELGLGAAGLGKAISAGESGDYGQAAKLAGASLIPEPISRHIALEKLGVVDPGVLPTAAEATPDQTSDPTGRVGRALEAPAKKLGALGIELPMYGGGFKALAEMGVPHAAVRFLELAGLPSMVSGAGEEAGHAGERFIETGDPLDPEALAALAGAAGSGYFGTQMARGVFSKPGAAEVVETDPAQAAMGDRTRGEVDADLAATQDAVRLAQQRAEQPIDPADVSMVDQGAITPQEVVLDQMRLQGIPEVWNREPGGLPGTWEGEAPAAVPPGGPVDPTAAVREPGPARPAVEAAPEAPPVPTEPMQPTRSREEVIADLVEQNQRDPQKMAEMQAAADTALLERVQAQKGAEPLPAEPLPEEPAPVPVVAAEEPALVAEPVVGREGEERRPPERAAEGERREQAPIVGDAAAIAARHQMPENHPLVQEAAANERARFEAEEAANTDSLTGLRNRRALDVALATHKGPVVSMDLAGLGYVNDNLGGHPAGDAFIKTAAQAIKEAAEAAGVRAFRAGEKADEFALLADSPEAAQAVADEIQQRFAKAEFTGQRNGQPVRYTGGRVDYGVGTEGATGRERLAQGDAELYRARQRAKDQGLRSGDKGARPIGLREVAGSGDAADSSASAPTEELAPPPDRWEGEAPAEIPTGGDVDRTVPPPKPEVSTDLNERTRSAEAEPVPIEDGHTLADPYNIGEPAVEAAKRLRPFTRMLSRITDAIGKAMGVKAKLAGLSTEYGYYAVNHGDNIRMSPAAILDEARYRAEKVKGFAPGTPEFDQQVRREAARVSVLELSHEIGHSLVSVEASRDPVLAEKIANEGPHGPAFKKALARIMSQQGNRIGSMRRSVQDALSEGDVGNTLQAMREAVDGAWEQHHTGGVAGDGSAGVLGGPDPDVLLSARRQNPEEADRRRGDEPDDAADVPLGREGAGARSEGDVRARDLGTPVREERAPVRGDRPEGSAVGVGRNPDKGVLFSSPGKYPSSGHAGSALVNLGGKNFVNTDIWVDPDGQLRVTVQGAPGSRGGNEIRDIRQRVEEALGSVIGNGKLPKRREARAEAIRQMLDREFEAQAPPDQNAPIDVEGGVVPDERKALGPGTEFSRRREEPRAEPLADDDYAGKYLTKVVPPDAAAKNLTVHLAAQGGESNVSKITEPESQTRISEKDGKPFIVGPVTPEQWLDRARAWIPDQTEWKSARDWYRQLRGRFEDVFGKGPDAVKNLIAWAQSQQNTSPSGGMMNVQRAKDLAGGVDLRFPEGHPKEGQPMLAGVGHDRIMSAILEVAKSAGTGPKLSDFLDATFDRATRSWVGNDARGGRPTPIDVWAGRDRGFIDPETIGYAQKAGMPWAKDLKVDSGNGSLTQGRYESGIKFYREIADYLNENNVDGGGWTPTEAQAVGWTAVRRMFGIAEESPTDIFTKNTRNVAFEAGAPGTGTEYEKRFADLTPEQRARLNEYVGPRLIEEAASRSGVRVIGAKPGVGGYGKNSNANWDVRVFGSPEQVHDFARFLGLGAQQDSVIASRRMKSGKDHGWDFRFEERPTGKQLKEWWSAAQAKNPVFERGGFTVLSTPDGHYLRLFPGSSEDTAAFNRYLRNDTQRSEFLNTMEGPLGVKSVENGPIRADNLWASNDWGTNRGGEGYSDALAARRRRLDGFDDVARSIYDEGEAAARGPAGPAAEPDQSLPQYSRRRTEEVRRREPRESLPADSPERDENLRRFMEGSAAVDEQGRPLRAYHGTKDAGFNEFDTNVRPTGQTGRAWAGDMGTWFTAESKHKGDYDEGNAEDVAGFFTEGKDFKPVEGGGVMPVHLAIKNPVEFEGWEDFADQRGRRSGAEFKKALEAQGHDGIVIRNSMTDGNVDRDDWVAFHPHQIKSAIGNSGTFDASNPDIRFSKRRERTEDEAPGFFSQLERVAEKIPQTMSGRDLRRFLADPKRQVKEAELKWSGLDDYLAKKGDAKVTPAEVQDFLAKNNVRVEEVTRGYENPKPDATSLAKRKEIFERHQPGIDEARRVLDAEVGTERSRPARRRLEELEEARDKEADAAYEVPAALPPKFSQYQTPGGENYRELLLTLPEKKFEGPDQSLTMRAFKLAQESGEDWDTLGPNGRDRFMNEARQRTPGEFRSGHFEEPNVLAHVRFNERTDADGKRVLFLEEVQSDWAQKGRREGFKGGAEDRFNDLKAKTEQKYGMSLVDLRRSERSEEKMRDLDAIDLAYKEAQGEKHGSAVPQAPFIGDTNAWSELAMKRMIRYAAENGFDRIAWTTGEQQIKRYPEALRNVADQISWSDEGDMRHIQITKRGEHVLSGTVDANGMFTKGPANGKTIEEVIGKTMAERILSEPSGIIHGEQFTVGGKGMEGFYDKIIPQVASKLGKKFGATVGKTEIRTPRDASAGDYNVDPSYRDDGTFVIHDGEGTAVRGEDGRVRYFKTEAEAKAEADRRSSGNRTPVHSMDITPQMRDSVTQEGQPLFSRRRENAQRVEEEAPREEPELGRPMEPGEAHRVDAKVDRLRQAAPTVSLSRDRPRAWRDLDPDVQKALDRILGSPQAEKNFYDKAATGRLNDVEVMASDALRAGKHEAMDAAATRLEEARAAGRDTGPQNAEYLKAAFDATVADYVTAARSDVEAGTKLGRALAARARVMNAAGKSAPDQFLKKVFKEIEGVTDAQAGELLKVLQEDPTKLQDALHEAMAPKGLSKWLEAWKAGLVSAPGTQVANVAGNVGEQVFRLGETAVAGLVDRLLPGPRSRYSGEARAEAEGFASRFGDASRQLWGDIKDIGALRPDKINLDRPLEYQAGKIGGKTGRAIRIPLRLLGAFDDFFKNVGGDAELGKLAYRQAKGELPKGSAREIVARKNEIVQEYHEATADGGHHPLKEAVEKGKKDRTFQGEPGKLMRGLESLRSANPILHLPLPFLQTPGAIAKLTAERSPFGFYKAQKAYRAFKAAEAKGADSATVSRLRGEAVDAITRPLVGTALMAAMVAVAKSGAMTGSGPVDQKERNLLKDTGWRPYSFVTTNSDGTKTYTPFQRFEPVSSLIGIAADIAEGEDAAKQTDLAGKFFGSLGQNFLSKTWWAGLSNAMEFANDPQRMGSQYLSDMAGTLVPNVVAKGAQALDPTVRDTRPEATGLSGLPERAWKTIASRIPGLSKMLPERRSGTGEPIQRDAADQGIVGAAERFLSPTIPSTSKPGRDLEAEMVAIGASPSAPTRDLSLRGKRIRLTDDEYKVMQDYDKMATDRLRAYQKDSRWKTLSDEDKKRIIRGMYDRAGDAARTRLLAEPTVRRRFEVSS